MSNINLMIVLIFSDYDNCCIEILICIPCIPCIPCIKDVLFRVSYLPWGWCCAKRLSILARANSAVSRGSSIVSEIRK